MGVVSNIRGCKHNNIVSFSVGYMKTVFMVTVETVLVYEAERTNETVPGCLAGRMLHSTS